MDALLSLSLWPLVLEKANREPSVLYEFLKGPAFAGRDGGNCERLMIVV